MDPQVKRRLKPGVTIYPYTGSIDGDKQFGDPIQLNGYCIPKTGVITNRNGVTVVIRNAVILDGADIDKVHPKDEIELTFTGRCPIQLINPLPGLNDTIELIEVLT